MKRFLLYLSALFLSVSFANAQTYSISKTTGTLNVESGKGSVWTSNDWPIKLTMTANCEGNTVNAIGEISASAAGLALYAYAQIPGVGNRYSVTYTVSIPENSGYKITAYSMGYSGWCTGTIKVENEINSYSQTVSKSGTGTMAADGLDVYSFSFTVSDPEARHSGDDIDINSFTVTLEQEGSAPAEEYTVSVIAGEGGTATVNGAAEATTTGKATLVAVPNYGYKFVNWTVGTEEVSTSAEYTATVNDDTEFVANFAKFENTDEWYAAIEKPTFGEAGNTTFVKSATVSGGVEAEVTGIPAEIGQTCVTGAIEVTPGAEFNLNITYQLNWGDLAIYQIDNDGATKEYGYYFGSWTATDPNTGKVIENIANDDISVSDIVDGVCTVTYPISINENHNVGDVIVVRAIIGVINNTTNSAFEKGIAEGGYVDFLFVVAEEEPVEDTSVWSTFYQPYPVALPEGANAYIVTAAASDYVTLTRFEGIIPANTAVILNDGEPKGEAVDVDFGTNLLKGTTVDTYIKEEAYVLSKVDGVVGFYKAEMTDGTWLNNAAKAYLPASAVPAAAQGAASFSFRFGDGTTGIEKVEISNEKSEIYDLTGRRVEEITVPGIYIVGGKKVFVR